MVLEEVGEEEVGEEEEDVVVSEAEEDEVLGVSGMATVALATTEGDRNAVSVGHLIINMTDSSGIFIVWRMIDV